MEFGVALLLHHSSRLGTPGLDPLANHSDHGRFRQADRWAADRHAPSAYQGEPGIEDTLAEGLKCRNLLIHRFIVDNAERIADAAQRVEVTKELRRLRAKVQPADKLLRPFVEGLSHAIDGLDPGAFRQAALSRFYGDQE